LTANFDAAKSASLAVALLDWKVHGSAYARTMGETALSLAQALDRRGVPVFAKSGGFTTSHQFAIEAAAYGGGQAAAKKLRRANILTCGIGLPMAPVEGDVNGLRIGTPEAVRWGMTPDHMDELAELISRAIGGDPEAVAADVTSFRQRFTDLHFVR
ncbi:MAG: serine hydroxymethyltransferase, partial [Hyphomicrobiales bacterium]